MGMRVKPALVSSLVLALLGASAMLAQGEAGSASYRIGPSDRLEIRIVELPDVNGEYEVQDDGTVDLPRVGVLLVRDSTEAELAARIRNDLLTAGLRQATVSVRVVDFRSRPVTVLGSVAQPGTVPIRGSMPLLDVLISVGGLAEKHGAALQVRRQASNGLSDRLEIPVEALMTGADPVANIPIYPGDLINVPVATDMTYYFMGEVEGPGEHTFRSTEGLTVLTAIARAGGLVDTASPKITILRLRPDGEREEIHLNVQRIMDRKDPDVAIQDGDIIVVKESFF